jgi:hypothetical protein
MRRWHEELPLMLARWRAEQRRHRNPTFGFLDDRCHCLRGPGTLRKRRPLDCGRARCGVCHWSKLYGYRPWREGTRRGRRDRRLEVLRHETAASGDCLPAEEPRRRPSNSQFSRQPCEIPTGG